MAPKRKKPPVGRRFAKGQSGNPGGRPKGIVALVKREVGENGEKLVKRLALYALATDAQFKKRAGAKYPPRHQDRLTALIELRNMGFGVPKQNLELSGPEGAPIPVSFYLPDNGRNSTGE